MNPLKILLTGGSGYVGSNILDLLSNKYKFTSIDSRNTRKNIDGVNYFIKDITEKIELDEHCFDGIVHLAGISRVKDGEKDARTCFDVNVTGTVNVLDYAHENNIPWVIIGGTVEEPTNAYGLSKKMANDAAKYYSEKNINVLVLKFSTIYGGANDNKDKLIPILINNAVQNKKIEISNGSIEADFIHFTDIAKGINLAIEYLATGKVGNYQEIPLCSGNNISLKRLSKFIIETFNSSSDVFIKENREIENVTSDVALFESIIGGFDRKTLLNGLLTEKNHIVDGNSVI
ncbi:MAG: NAD-dependent epimerase/dehydratase family protein [Ectothiorhodospiraceae bacterium]|nr:NAD-dependent epimerase/dehydratase family protein [Ectothiorhodospiraceae bacterium]